MKKYAFLSLIVSCGSIILNAQAPLPTKTVPELETLSLRSAEARKLQDDLKKATMEFMAAPESAEAENAFVQAQKAVFAYQKQQAEARKKYLEENKEQKQAEARLRESEKKLEEAKKAFRDNPEQQSARQNFVQAQKDVFAARKTFRPLILVDGKERADLQDIDHKNIKSVSVLKNPKDIAPYGEKGKNGVIRIVTNQETTNKETMEQLRLRYLCRAANLKDQQRTAFEKAYKSCSEQIEALRNENATLSQTATWQNALDKILKNNIAIEQKRYEMYKSLRNTLSDEQLSKLYRADLNFAKDMMSKGKIQTEQRPAPQQKGGAQPPRTGQRPAPDGKK